MSPTITVSPETYELLENRARLEGYSIDQLVESLLRSDVIGHDMTLTVSQQVWRNNVDRLLRQMLNLTEYEAIDQVDIPSAREIREELGRYIPREDKLSDEIVAMREEE